MLGIILVNYKNENELIDYIKCELINITEPHVIVVVDNSCDSESIIKIESELSIKEISNGVDVNSKLFLINAQKNLGYAKANNLGAKFLKKYFKIKYILFSNSDISFDKKNIINVLLKKLDENNTIAAINPMIMDRDLKYQTPMKEISIWRLYILKFLFYPVTRKITPIVRNAKEGEYFRLMGCFLLVRSCDFFEVGMFDEHTFLYGEELILSEKFRRIGKTSFYLPEVLILHNESTTIKNFISKRKRILLSAESELYYFKNYKGVNLLTLKIALFSTKVFTNIYLPLIILLKMINKLLNTNSYKIKLFINVFFVFTCYNTK